MRYDAMLVVDDKGDEWYKYPHTYVDFTAESGPFMGLLEYLKVGHEEIWTGKYTEADIFPEKFPEPSFGKIHKDSPLELLGDYAEQLSRYSDNFHTLYDADGRFN